MQFLEWVMVFFFFSSRRRHTRSDRDWSSDVCSSDLAGRSEHQGDGQVSTTSDSEFESADKTAEVEVPQAYRKSAAPGAVKSIIELTGVTKTYVRGEEPLTVLDGLDLKIPDGSYEALMGPSGSGKSTLLNLIAGLDRASKGKVLVAGSDLTNMSDGELAKFRARHIGFIFQSYNLMPVLTALENVELPLLLTKLSGAERKKRAETALRVVGLDDRMGHFPRQLSGGQEQRVAIARAIVADPTLMLLDEPTGQLDAKSSEEVLELLRRLNEEFHKTIMMVTHDPRAAEHAKTVLHLEKGVLLERVESVKAGGGIAAPDG